MHAHVAVRSYALRLRRLAALIGALLSGACADANARVESDWRAHDAGDTLRPRPDMNIPPASGVALEDWLSYAFYEDWTCEPQAHASQLAPQGRVRVCNNDLLLDGPTSGDYHAGSASVKELIDDGDRVIGRAVAVRGRPDPGATGWYFYARVQPGAVVMLGAAPDARGVIADGWGDADGNAQHACAQCHAGAPRDFVFTDLARR
jgi:hypothetical protein